MNMLKSMAISRDLRELKYEVSVSIISKSYAWRKMFSLSGSKIAL